MRQHVFARLHDTDLWANYRPHIPQRLYWVAAVGLLCIVAAWFYAPGVLSGGGLLGWLGGLLLTPVLLFGGFGVWKWATRTRMRNRLLDLIPWRGDEMVLDIGCGSGLLLNGAARRLTSGKAIGIDIWAPSGGGGSLVLLLKNAKAEGVMDRIEFKEADARQMPFGNAMFDVVMSSGALHHICHGIPDHQRLVGEIVRVLKPGGHIILWDITHMIDATALRLRQSGLTCEVKPASRFLGFEMSLLVGEKSRE